MPVGLDQLQGIYDIDAGSNQSDGPGPKPKPAPQQAKPIFNIDEPRPQGSFNMNTTSTVDVSDYGKILDQGVYSNQDIDQQRAQHQSVLAQTGHMLGNLPGNIIGSFLEGIGDIGLLAGQWGDDRTYHNALIDAGEQLHNLTGDIYMKHHDTIRQTISDPGWWIDQFGTVVEFSASYAALGAGVANTIGKTAEGVVGLIKAGQFGARVGAAASQLGTAGFMAYTMGANSAAQVFKGTYETQFQKFLNNGDDPDTAKEKATHIAAQSAATTAQLTTAIGTGLALTGMAPYFSKAEDVSLNILKKEVPQIVGESPAEWAARVKSIDPVAYASTLFPGGSLGHKVLEAGKMGVEMQQLQFGSKTGEDLGKKGQTKGFLDQFGEFEHYFDRTMDKDGALAFAIGAVSGIGMDKLRNDVIPSKWAEKLDPSTGQPIPRVNASGEEVGVEKKLYIPKAYSELHTQLKFNQMRDAVASDVSSYDKMQQSYLAAVKAGDPVATDRAADDMFNVNNVNAITSGMKDVWKQSYEQIANMSPDEALSKGFTKDVNDTTYKNKAEKASSALDRHQKIYDDLQDRYGTLYPTGAGFKPVVDGLFSRKVHLDGWDSILKDHEERIKKSNDFEDAILPIANPELFDQHTAEYARTWEATKDSIAKLKADHKIMVNLSDTYNSSVTSSRGKIIASEQMSILAREYQAIDINADNSIDSVQKSLTETRNKIQEAINNHQTKLQQAEDNMLNSSTYQQWLEKHPNSNFKEYYAKVQENVVNKDYAAQIDLSRQKYEIAKQNTSEIEKSKNLTKFANKYAKYMEEESKKSSQLEKQHNEELANRAKDKTTLDVAQRDQLNKMANRYRDIRDAHVKELNEDKERLKDVKKELERYENIKDFVRKRGLNNQKRELEKKIAGNTSKVKTYDSLYEQNRVPDATDTNPVSTDAITVEPPEETPMPEIAASIDNVDLNALAHPAFADTQVITTFEDVEQLVNQKAEEVLKQVEEKQKTVKEAEEALVNHLTEHADLSDAIQKLDSIQKQLLNGDGFSYDALNQEVVNGDLNQEEATNILQAVKEYVDAVQDAQDNGDVLDFMGAQPIIIEDEPAVVTIDEDAPSDVPIYNDFSLPEAQQYRTKSDDGQGGATFGGAKTVVANTIANSTLGYWEFAPDHNNEINLISRKDQVNEKTSMKVLKAGFLTPGTRIRYEVDTEYDGPKHLTGEFKQDEYGEVPQGHETFQDYSDNKGKVPSDKMGNVPIKIVDVKSGEKIGYVRKHEWVTEKYSTGDKQTGLRNIAERFDDDGNEINGAEQSRKILEIRKEIVDRFNASNEPTHGKVLDKGVGHPILNRRTLLNSERSKIEPGYAFNNKDGGLLPDPKLELVIAENGSLKSGKGFTTTKTVVGDMKDLPNGSVHVLLPGANGQHIPVPLVGKNLAEKGSKSALNTISRVLELYLQYTGEEGHPITKEIRQLENKTGHDVSSENGVRSFINQYFTYLQRFNDTATLNTGGQQKFLFNVWDKIQGKENKAWIKAAFAGSGEKPVYASIDLNTGKLNQQFLDVLEKGLATRSKAVVYSRDNLRGINEKRDPNNPFVDALYRSDGKWQHNNYKDYNEYVKSFSKTTAYGKNKRGEDYIYTANPSIKYDLDSSSSVPEKPTLVERNTSATKVNLQIEDLEQALQEVKPVYDKGLADELDDLFNASLSKEPVKEIGSRDEDKSKALTIENLEKLRNLLPEDQRNGKVPTDILRELQARGHNGLSDGYNPFSLCL